MPTLPRLNLPRPMQRATRPTVRLSHSQAANMQRSHAAIKPVPSKLSVAKPVSAKRGRYNIKHLPQ